MKFSTRNVVACAVAGLALVASACTTGGGGGGGGGNVSPTAVASASPNPAVTGQSVAFSSAGSNDPDGSIIGYTWDFGDGDISNDANPSHTYQISGSYAVVLLVTDNLGATGTDSSITMTVNDDAAGRYVATTGTDTGNCSSSTAKCATIGYAAGQAVSGDTVYVAAGSYPEIVNPGAKALKFSGANAGVSAGLTPGVRGPESVVRAFRGSLTATSYYNFTLDGFEINPTSDPALLTNATAIVNLFGGPSVSIVNNVFQGAVTYDPNCGYTCTTMGDYALQLRGGSIDISHNQVVNWRRPFNLTQSDATKPITAATIGDNRFSHITSRAISVGQNTNQTTMAGVLITGNDIDATGRGPSSTPAGMTITNNSNQVTNNTITGFSSGVYLNLCKKFSTDNNVFTGNTFVNNDAGVNVTTYLDTSQCVSSATEGSGGWVAGGGRANGLLVNNNTFTGGSAYAIQFNPDYGGYVPAITTSPLDVTCNWYDSAAGPSGGNGINQGPPSNAQLNYTPWLTTPTGPCDGT